jgi:anti-sigma factor RsiW
MNRDALEKLMIDRRLGELNAECSDLLDAYLEVSPADGHMARTMNQTIDLAKSAILAMTPAVQDMPALPDLAATRMRQTMPLRLWTSRLAVAAAIVFSFLVGSSRDWSAMFNESAQLAGYSPSVQDPSGGKSIWSVDRIRSIGTHADTNNRRLSWTSTAAWPNYGGRS